MERVFDSANEEGGVEGRIGEGERVRHHQNAEKEIRGEKEKEKERASEEAEEEGEEGGERERRSLRKGELEGEERGHGHVCEVIHTHKAQYSDGCLFAEYAAEKSERSQIEEKNSPNEGGGGEGEEGGGEGKYDKDAAKKLRTANNAWREEGKYTHTHTSDSFHMSAVDAEEQSRAETAPKLHYFHIILIHNPRPSLPLSLSLSLSLPSPSLCLVRFLVRGDCE